MNSLTFSLLITFIFLFLLVIYIFLILSPKKSFNHLTKDFKRKLWMTVGLGTICFSLTIGLVCLTAYFIRLEAFNLDILHKISLTSLIYLGLSLFAVFSFFIYLIRMFVMYIYMTKGKDS